jgi:hypothetical protein
MRRRYTVCWRMAECGWLLRVAKSRMPDLRRRGGERHCRERWPWPVVVHRSRCPFSQGAREDSVYGPSREGEYAELD